MVDRTHEDSTAADKTSIGFDYQYFYFLNKLLELKKGEKIGYEVKDDVHIELADGQLVLIQTKHSLKTNANNEPVNLTERDIDLWKTLYNWTMVINDNAVGRNLLFDQLAFIRQTEFVLASNKKDNDRNAFILNVKKCREEKITIHDFRNYLGGLIANSKEPKDGENKLKKYMEELNSQSDEWLAHFLPKIVFDLDEDDMIQKIKDNIYMKIYERNEARLEEVLHCVNSNTSIWKYENVKKGYKLEINDEEVGKLFYRCFHNARSDKLPNRKFSVTLPDNLQEQVFIKQLIEIGDIDQGDEYALIEYTTEKLKLSKTIESWVQNAELTEDEREQFEEDSVAKWRKNFRKAHRGRNNSFQRPHEENALECLDNVRDIELEIQSQKIGTSLSHGMFYSLSDRPIVGWMPDWEERYKK